MESHAPRLLHGNSCGTDCTAHLWARAYSADLRERVVASVEAGRSCRVTASLFGVSVASVVKWSQRKRLMGSAAAKRIGGSRRRVLCGSERDWLLARIAAVPDVTLRGVLSELAARGVKVSYGSVLRQIGGPRTRLVLPQNSDDLFFRKPPPLHRSVPPNGPDSKSPWRKNSGAGHWRTLRIRFKSKWIRL